MQYYIMNSGSASPFVRFAIPVFLLLGIASRWSIAIGSPINGDSIIHVLWFWDIFQNQNFLLSNWYTVKNSALFTEVPLQFLIGLTTGSFSPFVVKFGGFVFHLLTGFMVYDILRNVADSKAAVVGLLLFLTAAPFAAGILMLPNFHAGAVLSALLSFRILISIVVNPGNKHQTNLLLLLLFIVSSLSVFSDYMYVVIFVLPGCASLILGSFRAHGQIKRRLALSTGITLLFSVIAGTLLFSLAEAAGLHMTFASHNDIIPLNLEGVKSAIGGFIRSISVVFGILSQPGVFHPLGVAGLVSSALLLIGGLGGGLYFVVRGNRYNIGLTATFSLAAFVFLSMSFILRQVKHAYYLAPLVVIYAMLLPLLIAEWQAVMKRSHKAAVIVLVAISASCNIAAGFVLPKTADPLPGLVNYLKENRLQYGYAPISYSNIITFLSGDDIKVRPVRFDGYYIEPHIFHVNMDWYGYKNYSGPTFLIVPADERSLGFGALSPEILKEQFGSPVRHLKYGSMDIYEWSYNIIQLYWINIAQLAHE